MGRKKGAGIAAEYKSLKKLTLTRNLNLLFLYELKYFLQLALR